MMEGDYSGDNYSQLWYKNTGIFIYSIFALKRSELHIVLWHPTSFVIKQQMPNFDMYHVVIILNSIALGYSVC